VPIRQIEGNEAVVAFVHGFGGKAETTWGSFPDYIAEDPELADWDLVSLGYTTNLLAQLGMSLNILKRVFWSQHPGIQTLADGLCTLFDSDQRLRPYRAVALVAHSMGGLVAQRAVLDDPTLRTRTRKVVCYGTPSAGLKTACFGRWISRQVRDMAKEGRFVTKLRDDWGAMTEGGRFFDFVAVKGDTDEFVPAESSQSPFPKGECETVPGNHLEIVKPHSPTHLSVELLKRLLKGEGLGSAARRLVEKTEAVSTIRKLEQVPDLDEDGLVKLALAYSLHGQDQKAVELLEERLTDDKTDAMGTLGGRFKRTWQETHSQEAAKLALEQYTRGYALASAKARWSQIYYHGINLAYMTDAFLKDRAAAVEIARNVLAACEEAAKEEDPGDEPWRLATEAEAAAILGDAEKALPGYRAALACDPKPWQAQSMADQAIDLAQRRGDQKMVDALRELFYKR
jgi:pimeloyl-ACP methyl ester carboxylesterase